MPVAVRFDSTRSGSRATIASLLVLASLALLLIASPGAVQAAVQSHVACTDSWKGGTGSWLTGANWSTGVVPGSTDNVCITASGTYTVTLQNGDIPVASLQLGGSSGTQTLDLVSNATSATTLEMSQDSVINANGVLSLYSTQYTTYLRDTAITNDGTIETSGGGSFSYNEIYSNLTNEADGKVSLAGVNVVIPNNTVTANEGTWNVAAGTSLLTEGGSFVQSTGTIDNDGSIDVSGATFDQIGGGEVPGSKPITLTNSKLVDTGGSTGFFDLDGESSVQGTVQAKQTVVVNGASNDAEVTLRGSVTNEGHLMVPSARGDFSELTGGLLVNRGLVEALGAGTVEVGSPILNEHGAGMLVLTPIPAEFSSRTTNDGRFALARGARCDLAGGSLVDAAGSTTDVVVVASHAIAPFSGGRLTAAGGLSITTIGVPAAGSHYVLDHASSVHGRFAAVHGGKVAYQVAYTPTSVTLEVPARR